MAARWEADRGAGRLEREKRGAETPAEALISELRFLYAKALPQKELPLALEASEAPGER